MLGWQIFTHALRMVFGNFKQVMQITIGPALLGTILLVAAVLLIGIPEQVLTPDVEGNPDVDFGDVGLLFFILFFVSTAAFFWIAVAWHRFVLLEDYPRGFLPPFRSDRILAYFGRVILMTLLVMLCVFPLSLIIGGLAQAAPMLGAAVVIVAILAIFVMAMRLSITLPATAIGRPIRFGEAWAATKGSSGAILLMILVSFLFQIIVQLIITLLALIPVLGILVALFASMLIIPMINLSLLTTMYGVFIEKRALT